jgi:agmatine deiminase
MSKPTPRELGYRMPAEWEPHAATWLTWPRRDGISFPDRFEKIPDYWIKMCEILCPNEEVHINFFNDDHKNEILEHLNRAKLPVGKRIFLHHFPAYEPWCRDHGPIFVTRNGELAVVDWRYNAWGNKYPPYDLDDAVPQHVAKFLNLPLFSADIVMEGGALDVNGRGTLLTTESCLLNPNRNPHLKKPQIEQYLRDFLGVTNILWLGEGVAGDDTDGHIDDITRFVNETTVVTVIEDDPADENYAPLQENLKQLRAMKLENRQPLRIIELPMPGRVEHEGQRLPASYANFYIANGVVLVPTFSHKNDARALEILQKCFPDRKVIGIESTDLIWGLGAFHCVTQQQPAVSLAQKQAA